MNKTNLQQVQSPATQPLGVASLLFSSRLFPHVFQSIVSGFFFLKTKVHLVKVKPELAFKIKATPPDDAARAASMTR